jgi:hypothetical protein
MAKPPCGAMSAGGAGSGFGAARWFPPPHATKINAAPAQAARSAPRTGS